MKRTDCPLCGQKKDWSGDTPNCPFADKKSPFGENWMCGIIRDIRALCEREMDYRIHQQYCDDQYYAIIKVDELEMAADDNSLCLFVTWYKSRGATDGMWLLSNQHEPRVPTYEELETIIKHYSK